MCVNCTASIPDPSLLPIVGDEKLELQPFIEAEDATCASEPEWEAEMPFEDDSQSEEAVETPALTPSPLEGSCSSTSTVCSLADEDQKCVEADAGAGAAAQLLTMEAQGYVWDSHLDGWRLAEDEEAPTAVASLPLVECLAHIISPRGRSRARAESQLEEIDEETCGDQAEVEARGGSGEAHHMLCRERGILECRSVTMVDDDLVERVVDVYDFELGTWTSHTERCQLSAGELVTECKLAEVHSLAEPLP